MTTKHRMAVTIQSRQVVFIDTFVEEEEAEDACDLTPQEQQLAIDATDSSAWRGEARIIDVEEVPTS